MIAKILIALGLVIVVVLIAATFQPSEFRVSRSTLVFAPADKLFAEVDDFHRWQAWSPYEKLDPGMQRTFAGPAAGIGAIYGWSGDKNVGAGKMTITESVPAQKVGIRLEFTKPMAAVSESTFTFQPEGSETRVRWEMTGRNNYLSKIFCLFMNMDKMIGGQFEEGLANLKRLAEAGGKR